MPEYDPFGNPYEANHMEDSAETLPPILRAQAERTRRAHERKERADQISSAKSAEEWEPDFQGIKSPMFLVDMSFTRSGDVIIKLRIPFRWRHLVLPLAEGYNQPLEAEIKRWSRADAERRRLRDKFSTRQVGTVRSERESD